MELLQQVAALGRQMGFIPVEGQSQNQTAAANSTEPAAEDTKLSFPSLLQVQQEASADCELAGPDGKSEQNDLLDGLMGIQDMILSMAVADQTAALKQAEGKESITGKKEGTLPQFQSPSSGLVPDQSQKVPAGAAGIASIEGADVQQKASATFTDATQKSAPAMASDSTISSGISVQQMLKSETAAPVATAEATAPQATVSTTVVATMGTQEVVAETVESPTAVAQQGPKTHALNGQPAANPEATIESGRSTGERAVQVASQFVPVDPVGAGNQKIEMKTAESAARLESNLASDLDKTDGISTASRISEGPVQVNGESPANTATEVKVERSAQAETTNTAADSAAALEQFQFSEGQEMKIAAAGGKAVGSTSTLGSGSSSTNHGAAAIREQVVQQIATSSVSSHGTQKMTLLLNPEHLGQVEIQIQGTNDKLSVVITASGAEAEQTLREGLKELADGIVERSGRWQQVDIKVEQKETDNRRQERSADDHQDEQNNQDGRGDSDHQGRQFKDQSDNRTESRQEV